MVVTGFLKPLPSAKRATCFLDPARRFNFEKSCPGRMAGLGSKESPPGMAGPKFREEMLPEAAINTMS